MPEKQGAFSNATYRHSDKPASASSVKTAIIYFSLRLNQPDSYFFNIVTIESNQASYCNEHQIAFIAFSYRQPRRMLPENGWLAASALLVVSLLLLLYDTGFTIFLPEQRIEPALTVELVLSGRRRWTPFSICRQH
jgi:hypothetical protein